MITLTCPECLEQIGTKQELEYHLSKTCGGKHSPGKIFKPEPPRQEEKKPEKVQLTYVFKGQCPTCAGQLNTLEIDVEKKHFCIAFCNRCSKQVESREVVNL